MTSAQAIQVSVNGEQLEVPHGGNILSLLDFLKISPDRVAVELNKALVRKRDWETTEVGHEAAIEIVEFVGGG